MYCRDCGALNSNRASNCVSCGEVLRSGQWNFTQQPHVPNYLAPAILATLFCCLPFGIVAVVYAAQSGGRLAAGDYAGAIRASKTAQRWCWVSVGFAFIVALILLSFFFSETIASVWNEYFSQHFTLRSFISS